MAGYYVDSPDPTRRVSSVYYFCISVSSMNVGRVWLTEKESPSVAALVSWCLFLPVLFIVT